MRKFNFLRFLKKSRRGYILILVVFFIPIIMMGVKWCLDQSTLEQVKINSAGGNDSRSYKKCAKESALAVAQKWNPALTYNGQKESMLRLADEVYNNATAEGTATSLIGRAIPGLEIHPKYKITNKGTLFNPVQVTPYGEAQSFTTEGRKIAYKNDQTADHRVKQSFGSHDAPAEPYRRAYFLVKDPKATFETPFCDLVFCVSGSQNGPSFAFDRLYVKPDVETHTAMSALASGTNVSSYDTDEMSSTIQIRSTPDDPKLKLSVEGDKIKVQVDSDIADDKVGDVGYAVPAECNVDIILTIPTNAAACNKDNADANSTTAGSPSLVTDTAIQTTNSKATTASTAGVSDMRKSPIYQIAQAYRTFLRENFEFTRGVNVGLIPYSGKVSLPPEKADTNDEATRWTENVNSFVWNPTETKVSDRDDYLRGMFLYGASGKSGTPPTTALTKENYLWGGHLCPTRHGGYGILCRNVSTNETHAGNTMYVVDVLSTANPATHKFKRMNYCPCQVGAVNMLNMKCTKDCTQFCHNPYFIVPLTPDVTKIHDLMNAIVPFYDDHNQSNLICIPVTWANNLFQDWAYPKAITASDTEGGGRLSNPKPNSTRKKVLILVVNKPDWFEPCELTYLGFDNDYSEVPMVESDRIDFHTNYSDLTLKYADGSSYDNKIRGQSKILLAETDAGVVYNNDAKYYESEEGTVTLKFPRKALVKVVVEPIPVKSKCEFVGRIGTSWSSVLSFANGYFFIGNINYSSGETADSRSKDGINWENAGIFGDSASVHYVLNRYVSLSYFSRPIKTSTDGLNWNAESYDSPLWNASAYATCYYNNKLFYFTSTKVGISSDAGISWTRYTITGCSNYIYGACYGKGRLVVKDSLGNIYVSTDEGVNWTKSEAQLAHSDSREGRIDNKLTFAYNKFWACNHEGYVEYSDDLTKWVDLGKQIDGNGVSNFVFGNDKFLALDTSNQGSVYIWTPPSGLINGGDGKPSSKVTFSNISVSTGNLIDKEEQSVPERREFFIEADQIGNTKGADGNYYVTMSLENIRLISAEITNRPYEVKTIQEEVEDIEIRETPAKIDWEGTLEGTGEGAIITDAPFAIKINVEPYNFINMGDISSSTPLTFANGKFFASRSEEESYTSVDGVNWVKSNGILNGGQVHYVNNKYVALAAYGGDLPRGRMRISSNGITWQEVIKNDVWPWFSCGFNNKLIYCGGSSVRISTDSGTSWSNYISVADESLTGMVYGNGKLVTRSSKNAYISSDEGLTWTKKESVFNYEDGTHNNRITFANGKFYACNQQGYVECSEDGETWTALGKQIDVGNQGRVYHFTFGNGKFIATVYNRDGDYETKGYVWSPSGGSSGLTNKIEFPDLSQSHTITERKEFIFQANQLKKISDDEYRLNFEITNCKVISREFVSPADAMKEEEIVVKKLVDKKILVFTKLRAPEKSRVADFSEKSPLNGVDDLTMNEQNYRRYNESAGYWETSTENHVDSNVYSNFGFKISEFRGDFYFLIEDIGDARPMMRLFNRSKGPNTYQGVKCEEYYFGGLHRRYQDYLETRDVNYVSFDLDNAPASAKVRYHMAGFTLPMNSTLYYSYYDGAVHEGEWYKNSSNTEYPDASEAAKNLTKAALAKLAERSDLRIYLIKFRTPAQYKNNMTGKAANFDYTYLEGYATASGGKVYTIANDTSAEVNLAAKLTEIAADIKKFAGYSAAKIEE